LIFDAERDDDDGDALVEDLRNAITVSGGEPEDGIYMRDPGRHSPQSINNITRNICLINFQWSSKKLHSCNVWEANRR
jgi:hypothetical protein